MIVFVFHPGDLSVWQLAGIVGVFLGLTVLPISIIGFVIFKVIQGHSSTREEKSITLDLNKNR